MANENCPNCGYILKGDRPRFCDNCGYDLNHAEKPQNYSCEIGLSVNMNQFYMAGYAGIIDIKLENRSDSLFDSIKVELSGDLFAKPEAWSCRLGSKGDIRKKFRVKPANAGIELVQFTIFAQKGDTASAYWTEMDIPVFEKTKELQNVSIQADKLVSFGGATENAKNMGNSVKVNIENLIRQEKIHDANGLIEEYGKLSPSFRALKLEFDHHRTEQLKQSSIVNSVAKPIATAYESAKTKELDMFNYSKEINFAQDTCGLYVGENPCGITKIEGDAYVMAAQPKDYLGYEMSVLPPMTEFILEACIQKRKGQHDQWFGIEYGERYPGNYYQFLINGQGAVRISKHYNKEWRHLEYRDGLNYIRRGNAENILKIVRKGARFDVFVNGHQAVSVEDNDSLFGGLGLVVGWGIEAAFTGLKIKGVELGALFEKAMSYYEKMEMLEARPLFEYIKKYDPLYKYPGRDDNISQLFWEIERSPDYRKSICIVIGYEVFPQRIDGIAAGKLRGEINHRGDPACFQFAYITNDSGLLRDKKYMNCPLITIGGPYGNKVTADFMEALPIDPFSSETMKIQHNIEKGCKKAALWGKVAEETALAVDTFISSGLLDHFLNMIWMQKN